MCISSKGIDVGSKSDLDNKLRDVAIGKGTVFALYKLVGLNPQTAKPLLSYVGSRTRV